MMGEGMDHRASETASAPIGRASAANASPLRSIGFLLIGFGIGVWFDVLVSHLQTGELLRQPWDRPDSGSGLIFLSSVLP